MQGILLNELKPEVDKFSLHNRRYIGNKYKLIDWIFSIINKECKGTSFTDIFAGTGVVASVANQHFDEIIINDFLYSNHAIYNAFLSSGKWNSKKIENIISEYNNLVPKQIKENYFSKNFGNKYFSNDSAKLIGFIRDDIEKRKDELTKREYYSLITSLIYSIDKIANTVGHYDAFFKKDNIQDSLLMKPIKPLKVKKTKIFREDANLLAKKISTDIVYIDPPYNSRQYSRFYHVLETLTKWDKPELHGVALKPEPENISDYCKVSAKNRLEELLDSINTKHIVISYNNTYNPKSNSSKNKISFDDIVGILNKKGKTKVFEKDYRHFNAGNTSFNNHKEYLFVTKVNHV